MERLKRIRALLIFLRTGKPTLEDIMRFLALDTFFEFTVTSLFLNVVYADGTVHVPSGYGYDPAVLSKVPTRLISADTLFNRYLRIGEVGECGSLDTFEFAGPDYYREVFPNGFAFSFSFPVPRVGAVVVFCDSTHALTIDLIEFLLLVGKILSIELIKVRGENLSEQSPLELPAKAEYSLTPRQWEILTGIRANKSNASLAIDLGVSESLVRQETVRIYSKLGVAGRKDIQLRNDDFFTSENASLGK
jgi:DNA-binding CsgD family transcriptional regulator